jgi:hypothetical protein
MSGTYTFFSEAHGYNTAQTPLTVTIINTGTQSTGDLTVALDKGDASSFTLSTGTTPIVSIPAGDTAEFTVGPSSTTLTVGNHTDTVKVSGGNGISASFGVSFTVLQPSPTNLTTVKAALDYLASATGGDATTTPVLLKFTSAVNILDTSALTASAGGWEALMNGLANQPNGQNKYVALDLSACTMVKNSFSSTEFNTASSDVANNGKGWVVSLILPDTAQTIVPVGEAGEPSYPDANVKDDKFAFRHFNNLKEVRGDCEISIPAYAFFDLNANLTTVNFPNAKTIGVCAFTKCRALTTASFPKVTGSTESTGIGEYAFASCTALTMVDFPEATQIKNYAFQGCTALTTVSFPKVTQIVGAAFNGCTSLTMVTFPEAGDIGSAFNGLTTLATVNIPKVTTIGAGAFAYTGTTALTITMGSAPPRSLREYI